LQSTPKTLLPSCSPRDELEIRLLLPSGSVEGIADVQPHHFVARRVIDLVGPKELQLLMSVVFVEADATGGQRNPEFAASVLEREICDDR
jgi:hypothetical protein